MEKLHYLTLVEDNDPHLNWRVASYLDGTIWLQLSMPVSPNISSGYDVSTLYEVDFLTNQKKEVDLQRGKYVLWDIFPTEKYLYVSVLLDANNDGQITDEDCQGGIRLIQIERQSKIVKDLWTFDDSNFLPNIIQVVEDKFILLSLIFKNENGEAYERYDLIDVAKNQKETVHVDNEEMMECKIFIAKSSNNGIVIVKDIHVTPSDKPLSGGKADRIIVEQLPLNVEGL